MFENVPGAHTKHDVAGDKEKFPMAQSVQVPELFAPIPVANFPAGQLEQLDIPNVSEYVPAGHAEQLIFPSIPTPLW